MAALPSISMGVVSIDIEHDKGIIQMCKVKESDLGTDTNAPK